MSESVVPSENETEWQGLAHPKKRAYLDALVKCGSSQEACRASGVGYRSIFRWRKQDELFAGYEEKAKAIGIESYKDELESLLDLSTLEGKPLRPNTVTRAWTKLAVSADVKVIRLHDARHTHASLMLKQGIHPKIVQERLGHSSIQITLDTYSHVSPGLQQAAAESFDKMMTPRRKEEAVENLG